MLCTWPATLWHIMVNIYVEATDVDIRCSGSTSPFVSILTKIVSDSFDQGYKQKIGIKILSNS